MLGKKVIFYCYNCHATYGGEDGRIQKCPHCGQNLINTGFDRELWRNLTEKQKEEIRVQFKEAFLQEKAIEDIKIKEKNEFNARVAAHKHTTGFNFEGYEIVEYFGVVSGECVIGTGLFSEFSASFDDLMGGNVTSYNSKLVKAREIAKNGAVYHSALLGGNALIGVDIDYITFSADKIGVIYTGTSVLIRKK